MDIRTDDGTARSDGIRWIVTRTDETGLGMDGHYYFDSQEWRHVFWLLLSVASHLVDEPNLIVTGLALVCSTPSGGLLSYFHSFPYFEFRPDEPFVTAFLNILAYKIDCTVSRRAGGRSLSEVISHAMILYMAL